MRGKKRLLCGLLALLSTFAVTLTMSACDEDSAGLFSFFKGKGPTEAAQIPTNKDLFFVHNIYGTYEVAGIGRCEDVELVIPEYYNGVAVTSIGAEAFKDCKTIRKVSIPKTMQRIERGAFQDCESLKVVNIPASVKRLDENVFAGCHQLEELELLDGLTTIRENAFNGCESLTKIKIPNTVKEIGQSAFANCISLTSVIISNTMTTLENNVFYNCSSLEMIVLQDKLTSIGEGAFQGCEKLTKLDLPSTLNEIGEAAFAGCNGLSSATFKNVNGWKVGNVVLDVSSPTQNAVYLSETYMTEKWTRS